jgi:hypothetical protein
MCQEVHETDLILNVGGTRMSYAMIIMEQSEPSGTREAYPVVDSLSHVDGVFCMGEAAWIFDTTKAIVPFGLLIAQASEQGLQLYVFHLPDDSFRLHATSYPRSEKLQQFLNA